MIDKNQIAIPAIGLGILSLLMSGCQTMSGPLTAEGIPEQRYLVGGGLNVYYVAPEPGTLYVVEENLKQIWVTRVMDTGNRYQHSRANSPFSNFKELFGIDHKDIKVSLYFVPQRYFRYIPRKAKSKDKMAASLPEGAR